MEGCLYGAHGSEGAVESPPRLKPPPARLHVQRRLRVRHPAALEHRDEGLAPPCARPGHVAEGVEVIEEAAGRRSVALAILHLWRRSAPAKGEGAPRTRRRHGLSYFGITGARENS